MVIDFLQDLKAAAVKFAGMALDFAGVAVRFTVAAVVFAGMAVGLAGMAFSLTGMAGRLTVAALSRAGMARKAGSVMPNVGFVEFYFCPLCPSVK